MTIYMCGLLKLKSIRGQNDRQKTICRKTENVFMAVLSSKKKNLQNDFKIIKTKTVPFDLGMNSPVCCCSNIT